MHVCVQIYMDCYRVRPTWQLSAPAAVVASLLSESGWCATPGHMSSSEDCRAGHA